MKRQLRSSVVLLLLAFAAVADVHAFVVGISPAPRSLYLRVGDGDFSNRDFDSGGTPRSGGNVNQVSVVVPAPALLTGADQPMTSTSRVTSDYDSFLFCNAGQTYVGGFFRSDSGTGNATLTAVVTTPLTSGTDTIPFSQIRWTATGNASGGGFEGGVQPIAANNFGDVSKSIATFQRNTWNESCHNFFYSNDNLVSAGTYLGTITYTLTAP